VSEVQGSCSLLPLVERSAGIDSADSILHYVFMLLFLTSVDFPRFLSRGLCPSSVGSFIASLDNAAPSLTAPASTSVHYTAKLL